MAEIVNLRSMRKQKARAEKERAAEANRALHGRSKAEKLTETAKRVRETASHEGHRRERPSPTAEKDGER